MKGGKHRPSPPATTPILEVLALLALLEWRPEGTENLDAAPEAWLHESAGQR